VLDRLKTMLSTGKRVPWTEYSAERLRIQFSNGSHEKQVKELLGRFAYDCA
jgi:hypothetical protein